MANDDDIITQVGRNRLARLATGYEVQTPTGNTSFEKFIDAYFAYLDAIGWTDPGVTPPFRHAAP